MPTFLATTTGTLLGGVGTDRHGDEVDVDAVRAEGIPASLIEIGVARPNRPVDARTDQVRTYRLRVGPQYDLRKYNRFRDDADGGVYTFDAVTRPVNNVGHRAVSVVVRRMT
jgi:hypothetical protein